MMKNNKNFVSDLKTLPIDFFMYANEVRFRILWNTHISLKEVKKGNRCKKTNLIYSLKVNKDLHFDGAVLY